MSTPCSSTLNVSRSATLGIGSNAKIRRPRGAPPDEQAEHPDVRAHVEDARARCELDAVSQIASAFEDLVVEEIGFVPIEVHDRQAIGQLAPPAIAEPTRALPRRQSPHRRRPIDPSGTTYATRRPGIAPPRRVVHGRVAAHRCFDLAELDAEAADLHLVVEPPEILEIARRPAAAPDRRSDTAGRRVRRRTDPGRSAPPSAAAGPDSRAPLRRRRRTVRRARRSATGSMPLVEDVHGQIRNRLADDAPGAVRDIGLGDSGRYVTCTVVSVMPYMLIRRGATRRGARPTAAASRTSSASPPKMTDAQGQRRADACASASISCRNADGVWLSTVTRSSLQQLARNASGRSADQEGHDHQAAAVEQRAPHLPHGEVERHGVEERPDVDGHRSRTRHRSRRTA